MDIPDNLTARARALLTGDPSWQAPPVRDAATIALCRDTASGVEVFVMRRVRAMAFAAGMHVFPGGAVEPSDADVPWVEGGREAVAAQATRMTAPPDTAAALVAAAVRETFEESGVLLAVDPSGVTARDPGGDRWEAARQALLDGSLTLGGLLADLGLVLDPALLPLWSHWITPEVEGRRFDTRFFVAAVPPGQAPRDVGGEADRVRWVSPAAAAVAARTGEMPMLPPTLHALDALAPAATVADVLAAAPARVVFPLMPRPVLEGDAVRWALVDARDGTEVAPG